MSFTSPGVTLAELSPSLGSSSCKSLAINHNSRYLVTTCANAAVLWQRTSDLGGQASSPAQLSVLRGHKREVTQVDFNRGQGGDEDTREQEELITCSYDRVILWNVQDLLQSKNPNSGAGGTTVAREMGDISSCRLVKHKKSKIGWIALGIGSSVWLLRLNYKPLSSNSDKLGLKSVNKHVVIETQHAGNISDILMVTAVKMVVTSGEDSKIKFWNFQGEAGSVLGDARYPVNCLAINSSSLLAVGDCGGGLRIYHVQSALRVVLVTSIDLASIFAKKIQTDEDQARVGCDVLSLCLPATERNMSTKGNAKETNKDDLPSLLEAQDGATDSIIATRQTCYVVTTLGCCVLNLRSRMVLEIVIFSQLASPSSSVLASVASRAAVTRCSESGSSLISIFQTTLDNKCSVISLPLAASSCQDSSEVGSDTDSGCCVVSLEDGDDNSELLEVVTTIPRDDIVRGSLLDLNHKTSEMSKQSLTIIRKGSLPLEKMKNNLKIFSAFTKSGKSSGYGKEQPRPRMFQPHLNKTKPRPRKNNLFHMENSSSEPNLSCDVSDVPDLDSPKTRTPGEKRMRWSLESAPLSRKSSSILDLSSSVLPDMSSPPSRLDTSLRLWDECARSLVSLSPGLGRQCAVSGARASVQVLSCGLLTTEGGGGRGDTQAVVTAGQRLVGHTGQVTSLAWSRTGDWLVTAGVDKVVKVWDWRSRRVSLNINSKKGGQWEDSFGAVKKSSKDQTLFSEPVNKAQMFYMDNLLLAVSSNRLFMFNINLPERGDKGQTEGGQCQYKLAKTVTMSECKTITTMSAVNQFYSFLALVACSDRSVRVYDVNQAKVVRQFSRCHSRSTHAILQNEGSSAVSHPESGYDLFITAALSDGVRMWDLRSPGQECVQKYDSPGSVSSRHQCRPGLSPCMRYLATGAEDGHVYVYDTRHVTSWLCRLDTCGPEVITDVAFSPSGGQLVAASLEGIISSFSI